MALIACEECGKEISADALICPSCGKPNIRARNKAKNTNQKIGCGLVLIGLVLAFIIHPLLGAAVFIVGLIVALLNTRYS